MAMWWRGRTERRADEGGRVDQAMCRAYRNVPQLLGDGIAVLEVVRAQRQGALGTG